MKIAITGASHFINRMFEACGTFQWAREFLKNSLEAKAEKVEFGIEWRAVEKLGVYRRTIADNGIGMDAEELGRFFKTIGAGGKKIGGVHDNFGVGAKIASLPWNPEGVVVISYKNSKASMIWIVLDSDSGEYELMEFETSRGISVVVDPSDVDSEDGIKWGSIHPDWIIEHGTVIVLLGSKEFPDTVLGNPDANEKETKGLSGYLNTRFWDLGKTEVKVVELRSDKKNQWAQSTNDKDDSRRVSSRSAMGAKYYLTDLSSDKAKLHASDALFIDSERVMIEWYLWKGERPEIHSYAKRGGYIAIRYKDELFELTSHKVNFRLFGIIESKVQQNLTIILEPQHYGASNGRWGIHPDQSRNRLIFTGNGEKGGAIPLVEWGREFSENIPEEIMKAIMEVRGDVNGSIENEEYRKRLQDRFGNRWNMKILVQTIRETKINPSTLTNESVKVSTGIVGGDKKLLNKHKTRHTMKAIPAGHIEGIEREVPVDIPFYRFVSGDDFEKPFHLASWAPNDPKGPSVLLNSDSQILLEIIKHHQEQYMDIYAEEVAKTVREVFGELAVSKIAHSQKLTRDVPRQDLDQNYRSEAALTISLMGLMAEDALIAQRLRKLGQKKVNEESI